MDASQSESKNIISTKNICFSPSGSIQFVIDCVSGSVLQKYVIYYPCPQGTYSLVRETDRGWNPYKVRGGPREQSSQARLQSRGPLRIPVPQVDKSWEGLQAEQTALIFQHRQVPDGRILLACRLFLQTAELTVALASAVQMRQLGS